MKTNFRLTLTAALALTVTLGTGVAMMPAAPQDKPAPKAPTPPAAKDKPAMPEGMPDMPPPGEHHKWLEKLVGNWNVETEMIAPGQPPMTCTGTDSTRSIGGRWVVSELKSTMPAALGGEPMNAILSLGYNPETGKYQGTWIDTMTDHMWVYVGTLDAAKKTLTLEAEGPNMMDPASKEKMKYRDVIEFKSDDHRTLTSSAFQDGKWVPPFVTANYRRMK